MPSPVPPTAQPPSATAGARPAADARRGAVEPQCAAAVLMVRPACFAFNPQTAASNAFQRQATAAEAGSAARALREFDALARQLQHAGARVIVADDSASPPKPDAVFPNNWVSFHHDGTVVLYPMLAPNRRLERRDAVLQQVTRDGGYQVTRTVDLTYREDDGKFLEGTGSLVLDRANRVAYACLSPRTDLDLLGEFAQVLDYELVTFEAFDGPAQPVYHTNVLMAVGTAFALLCGEAIDDPAHRAAVTGRLRATGHEVIDITRAQMRCFAGNLLQLAPAAGQIVALSQSAWSSLDPAQRRRLEAHGSVIVAAIPTIEGLGGGSVRCMLAEVHLPGRGPRR